MTNPRLPIAAIALVFTLSGCYTARITSNTQASDTVIKKEWAHSFLGGLVPPEEIDASDTCTNGIHQVETKLSFLNLVAQAITFGIYSPMTLTVVCAR